jgi:hypothetical protein
MTEPVPVEKIVLAKEPLHSLTIASRRWQAWQRQTSANAVPAKKPDQTVCNVKRNPLTGHVQLKDFEMCEVEHQKQKEEFHRQIAAYEECECDTCLSNANDLHNQQIALATKKEELYELWWSSLGKVEVSVPVCLKRELKRGDMLRCINPKQRHGLRIYECNIWGYLLQVRPFHNWPHGHWPHELSFGPIMYKLPNSDKWVEYTLGFGGQNPGGLGLLNLCLSVIGEISALGQTDEK